MIKLTASILSADFAHLAADCQAVIDAGFDSLHIDVMDHHYVPNLSFGPVVVQKLRKAGVTAPMDVHLMVENPDQYIEPFAKAGVDFISVHPQTTPDLNTTIKLIRSHGVKAGLVFNPDQEVEVDEFLLSQIDMILLMSVFPGFSGQKFIESVLPKVRATRELVDGVDHKIHVAIDGGIKLDNINKVVEAGADFIIMGSGIFGAEGYREMVKKLRAKL